MNRPRLKDLSSIRSLGSIDYVNYFKTPTSFAYNLKDFNDGSRNAQGLN